MSDQERPAVVQLDELSGLVGSTLGTSRWHILDQVTIDAFAEATEDHQWIHVDPERAAAGPFGTTIAHGFLTLSLCAPMLDEVLEVHGASMQVNYGLDRVRFPAAVPAGARVRGVIELASATEVEGGVQIVLKITIAAEGHTKPACVAELVVRLLR